MRYRDLVQFEPIETVIQLRDADREDDLLIRWRKALRDALTSDTAQGSMDAMTPVERRPIDNFLEQADDAVLIAVGFVEAAVWALRGIQAIDLRVEDLLEPLREGGLPCTVEELERRFDGFVSRNLRGHDAKNTRLMLTQTNE